MKTMYLDCSAGASGDMLLGALIELYSRISSSGQSPIESHPQVLAPWSSQLEAIRELEPQSRMELKQVERQGVSALKVDFYVGDEHADSHLSHHHRRLQDVKDILRKRSAQGEGLSADSLSLAERIFTILAQAEAVAHQSSVTEVHFHEVAAFDSLMDIAGIAVLVSLLKPEKVVACPPAVGSGSVHTAHGLLSVPAPAVEALIEQNRIPTATTEIPFEALTPTGAAVLATVVDSWEELPEFAGEVEFGVGAGNKSEGPLPNVVRAFMA